MIPDRIETTIAAVGTSFVIIALEAPAEYVIKRARAEIVSGSGSTVALRVAEASSFEGKKIPLEYSATATPLDSAEDTYFKTTERQKDFKEKGTTWIAVMCDTTGNTVEVTLDIRRE